MRTLQFNYNRRFGLEIEVNSFDNRDFKKYKLKDDELPEGIYHIANLISNSLGVGSEIKKWGLTHNNEAWILKPDSSCGIEICSPVSKGAIGVKETCDVIKLFENDPKIIADDRCSLHVHVEVEDCGETGIGAILSWWIKAEAVFLDSVKANRKRNIYCQCIGLSDLFQHNTPLDCGYVIDKLQNKYYTMNTYQMHKGQRKRKTLEFRIMGAEGCKSEVIAENWTKLILHFVEMAIKRGMPGQLNDTSFKVEDQFVGYRWLNPRGLFEFLGFIGNEYELKEDLQKVRNWFLARLYNNTLNTGLPGIWSDIARTTAMNDVKEIIKELGLKEEEMHKFL